VPVVSGTTYRQLFSSWYVVLAVVPVCHNGGMLCSLCGWFCELLCTGCVSQVQSAPPKRVFGRSYAPDPTGEACNAPSDP